MPASVEYRYEINILYYEDKKEHRFNSNNIHNLLIDYDYENKNRPILFVTASIDRNILDHMITNKENGYVVLEVSKYKKGYSNRIKEKYIKDKFIYFIDDTVLNKTKSLDYAGDESDNEDKFHIVKLGLMKKDTIDNNKVLINDIVNNTTMINIIYKHMKHMNLLIEPLDNNKVMNNFIIPPITTITKFINYLDNANNLYNSNYRLFFDHDITYLVSSKGNPIKSKKDDINSFIIHVKDNMTIESKEQGIFIDRLNKRYVINVDATDVDVFRDKDTIKSTTSIIAVDSEGNVNKADISKDDVEKIYLKRINNSNLKYIDNQVDRLKDLNIVNIVKNELDTSLITINKEYIIKNYKDMRENDGKYILNRKREIYTREGEDFILTCVLTLVKKES